MCVWSCSTHNLLSFYRSFSITNSSSCGSICWPQICMYIYIYIHIWSGAGDVILVSLVSGGQATFLFLYPFVLTLLRPLSITIKTGFLWDLLSLHLLCLEVVFHSHVFLLASLSLSLSRLTCLYLANKIHPVYYKTCTKPLLYHKTCTKYFPVLLRITKFAQSTSRYYFVLQSFHKSTSQYYFVLQSFHKVLPSITSYYKACTKYFPVLLRTTKLAQSTSRYYFVLQNLHKVLPSTTSYYKACTKYHHDHQPEYCANSQTELVWWDRSFWILGGSSKLWCFGFGDNVSCLIYLNITYSM